MKKPHAHDTELDRVCREELEAKELSRALDVQAEMNRDCDDDDAENCGHTEED